MVAQSVRIYNQERPHTALQYRTPYTVDQACMQQETLSTYFRTGHVAMRA
ncbi:transposase [Janthinobacterium sp. BJB401]|nr:transposase [Janthinobacterium sp. BJB401]